MKFLIKFSLSPLYILPLFTLGVMFSSCEGIESSQSQKKTDDASGFTLEEAETKQIGIDGQDSQRSRGLDMANARRASLSFADNFPLLYKACNGDTELLGGLESYAKRVLEENIASEQDILSLMEERDSSLVPYLTPVFENMDAQELDKNWGGYQEELKQLGMTMTAAEGMFSSLGAAPFLEEKINEIASEELKAYIQFLAAQTESRNGEYPFQNMKPFRDMVLLGEEILAGNNDTYKGLIDEDFQYALEAFTDVHVVSSP
ncbi:MAG: hypothetical protein AAF696_27460, partial [Bacteroidota bacterium]